MKAILHERYGRPDVLELRDVDKPTIGDDQVLVRVHASSVNPVEWYGVSGPYFARLGNGMRRPKDQTVGADLAGVVEAVGRDVTQFEPGDEVFGVSGGSWAEYTIAREERLAKKPDNLSFEEAAAVPVAAVTALQALRDKGQVQAGQKVLINGASGGVGTFAIQLAKLFGADVTAVCSTGNVEQARSLGADRVVDYTKDDFTDGRVRYDVVQDNVGNHPLRRLRRAVTPTGTLVSNAGGSPDGNLLGPIPAIVRMLAVNAVVRQRLRPLPDTWTREHLLAVTELVAAGQVTPVVGRTYPLADTAAAMHHLEQGHARGKVVVTVG